MKLHILNVVAAPRSTYKFLLALGVLLVLAACGGGGGSSTETPEFGPGELVSSVSVANYTGQFLESIVAQALALGVTEARAQYEVDVYAVRYATSDTAGNTVQASGLVAVPRKEPGQTSPILSWQHGTIFLDSEAPSGDPFYYAVAAVLATQGYIVLMPDYLGYQVSGQILHPYVHADSLAAATVDLIRASQELLTDKSVSSNDELFLAGYSEGGYATLAAQRLLEQDLAAEYPVTASIPAAGPYDLSTTAAALLAEPVLTEPTYVAFVFKAYDTVYDLARINALFQPQYVDVVDAGFDGSMSGDALDAALTNITAELFNPIFLAEFNGDGETELKAILAENDVYDWAPSAPTRLFHGANDTVVPYLNADNAAAAMGQNGATDVAAVPCYEGDADHGDCFIPSINYMLGFFASFASNL